MLFVGGCEVGAGECACVCVCVYVHGVHIAVVQVFYPRLQKHPLNARFLSRSWWRTEKGTGRSHGGGWRRPETRSWESVRHCACVLISVVKEAG